MEKLVILNQIEKKTNLAKIAIYQIKLPIEPKFSSIRMGFDVGTTHIGLASINPIFGYATLYQISVIRMSDTMQRIISIHDILTSLEIIHPAIFDVIIENSAYSKPFRQTELAEIRTATAIWFYRCGGKVQFIAPNSIRKQVFGNGRIRAIDMWESEIGKDALDALACSYYINQSGKFKDEKFPK